MLSLIVLSFFSDMEYKKRKIVNIFPKKIYENKLSVVVKSTERLVMDSLKCEKMRITAMI